MTATKTTSTETDLGEVRRESWSAPKPYHYGSPGGTDYYTAVYTRRTYDYSGEMVTRESRELYISAIPGDCGHLVSLSSYRVEDEPANASAPLLLDLPKPQDHLRKQPHRPSGKVGRFDSTARRRDVLRRLAERVNTAAGIIAVADLLATRGASADLIRRYASPVGRAAAKAYRAATGTEPRQSALIVTGRRLARGFGYRAADGALLDAVIDGYEVKSPVRARLTDLIGAS